MKIDYSFYTTKNLSGIAMGDKFMEILNSNGLWIDKISDCEPIKQDFDQNIFKELWEGRGTPGEYMCGNFLFKGMKDIRFAGSVNWIADVEPGGKAFNGASLWINTKKNLSTEKLISIGDELFEWSGASYGYITDESKNQFVVNGLLGSIYRGIPGLMWVNYFGNEYITETDFNIKSDCVFLNGGARLQIRDSPTDEKLSDQEYLRNMEHEIGEDWFWIRTGHSKVRRPDFNHIQQTRLWKRGL